MYYTVEIVNLHTGELMVEAIPNPEAAAALAKELAELTWPNAAYKFKVVEL